MDIAYLDGVVIGLISLSALLAYVRGFIREALAVAGWVGSFVVAYLLADTVRPFVVQIPGLDGFLGRNCEWAMLAAFVATLIVAITLSSFLVPSVSSMISNENLARADRTLGMFFGLFRGVFLVGVALMVYQIVTNGQFSEAVDRTLTAEVFRDFIGSTEVQTGATMLEWLSDTYGELVSRCDNPAT